MCSMTVRNSTHISTANIGGARGEDHEAALFSPKTQGCGCLFRGRGGEEEIFLVVTVYTLSGRSRTPSTIKVNLEAEWRKHLEKEKADKEAAEASDSKVEAAPTTTAAAQVS
eukprot:TRINITY_DN28219_c0_g1_i1.p1 TRINITY_DN28219_c0_g1~~TRINITY_DN28219_c0_g1_i1.p1  ORF type:complete len:112 (+),score=19.89 TRINITY_DN28219_c0_g1_i1:384-719(+)